MKGKKVERVKRGAGIQFPWWLCLLGSCVIGLLLAQCKKAAPTPAPDDVPMVHVPAGEFVVGSSQEDVMRFREQWTEQGPRRRSEPIPDYVDEFPQRTVYLEEFYIDKYEVTNTRYRRCVEAGACNPPQSEQFADPAYADHPVVEVTWGDADAFCRWVGKRLPAELEWEKAARGTDGRLWPWGNEWDKSLVQIEGQWTTQVVGSFPADASPYGVMDMAGNVEEWVADWYLPYVGSSLRSEDFGEKLKVARGGGFYFELDLEMRTARRAHYGPDQLSRDIGFRCVRGGTSPALEPTYTPGPTITPDMTGRDMVLVPEGKFLMGNEMGEPDERPEHTVYLDAFYIDRCEVSNAQYVAFLNDIGSHIHVCGADDCTSLKEGCCRGGHILYQDGQYMVEPGYEDYPVGSVTWYGAKTYCEHYGLRLLTEAEWEKAARGTDGRMWPWGNEWDPTRVTVESYSDPLPVCSNLRGASPYGVLNMSDNVSEWVSDWYDENYYTISPSRNPQGPDAGDFKSSRGSSPHLREDYGMRITQRSKFSPGVQIGFRCTVSVSEIERP